jgi:hypothetical protein
VAYVFLYAVFYLEASASNLSPAVAALLQIAVPAATLAGAACLRLAIGGLSTRRA